MQLKMPGASSFSKTGRYRVTSTLARRQWLIFRVATIFVPAHLIRTSPERTYSCCNNHFKTSFEAGTFVSAPEGASADPKELPRLSRPEG